MSGFTLRPRLGFGLVLVGAGLALLASRLGFVAVEIQLGDLWPVAFLGLGVFRLADREWGNGLFLFVLGVGLLAVRLRDDFSVVDLLEHWPLLLIGLGELLVIRSLLGSGKVRSKPARAGRWPTAVLRTLELEEQSNEYRGEGLALAVLGGLVLDLGQARLAPEGAEITVFAFWGGIEIKVPSDWEVDVRVSAILGGSEQKSQAPRTLAPHGLALGRPRLIVRGLVMMAGVEVHD